MSLANRRVIKLGEREIIKTPLLIPSFSSKGFPDVQVLIDYSDEFIIETYLISAYDLSLGHIKVPQSFPEIIFIDSGGYECSKDVEFSDLNLLPHKPVEWTEKMHKEVLNNWTSHIPTVAVSFDNPKARFSLDQQIENAKQLFKGKNFVREILIKPETESQKQVQISNIINNIHEFASFDILGLTEKELGNTLIKRMQNIALIRAALTKADIHIPIHIFGSLDTISTPLYFLAGADIFDGLTWLRMAYHKGFTMYMHNCAIYDHGPKLQDQHIKTRIITKNCYALQELQLSMGRYLNHREFKEFTFHSELFERTFQDLISVLGGT
ncbi:MAG: hypothetical protein ACAH12_00215 [Methylophilaceae bacterium]